MNCSDGFFKNNSPPHPTPRPGLSEFFLKSYFPGTDKMDKISERHSVYRRWQARGNGQLAISGGLADVTAKLHTEWKHTRGRQWTRYLTVRNLECSWRQWVNQFGKTRVGYWERLQLRWYWRSNYISDSEGSGVTSGTDKGCWRDNQEGCYWKGKWPKLPLAVRHSFKLATFSFIWPSRFQGEMLFTAVTDGKAQFGRGPSGY